MRCPVCGCTLISIHALLAESDDVYKEANFPGFAFLSTLSLRRATTVTARIIDPTYDFYPRSPCGERRGGHICKASGEYFYPRSPCGERPVTARIIDPTFDFYPRSPCGERLFRHAAARAVYRFLSTLSLRRATPTLQTDAPQLIDFYPRSPCGERQARPALGLQIGQFLSTLSLRRATKDRQGNANRANNFYPRSPCGERLL